MIYLQRFKGDDAEANYVEGNTQVINSSGMKRHSEYFREILVRKEKVFNIYTSFFSLKVMCYDITLFMSLVKPYNCLCFHK